MDARELDVSNQDLLSSSYFGEFPECSSTERLFSEILTDMHACIHMHTCNPPGPDHNSHTHTCYHVHTTVVPPLSNDTARESKHPAQNIMTMGGVAQEHLTDIAESIENAGKKCTSSNKEAVKRYREKKKAQYASLEDEVVRLRAMNQKLSNELKDQAVLQAEILRLKCLLVDIRGRIEGEIGSFPYQKPMESGNVSQNLVDPNLSGACVMNSCNLQCDDPFYCLYPGSQELDASTTVDLITKRKGKYKATKSRVN